MGSFCLEPTDRNGPMKEGDPAITEREADLACCAGGGC